MEGWLGGQLRQRLASLLPSSQSRWMPREQWDALVRGEDCLFCTQLQQESGFDGYGFIIADLSVSRLTLTRNQYIHGECVLAYKNHVKEFHQLSQEERHLFIDDLAHASRAIEKVFAPLKIGADTGSGGYPHLYWRIKPRYYGDTLPAHLAERTLPDHVYTMYVSELRDALSE
ncbi:hypothetical protein KDH_23270 [Dictyobacter sp. S3.2.2.5]|uniref:HIT domain-containing protein n=1 Tax=Dictyobacter halimunensis TaxID=3026934 RepID=A0ABQ6FML3_9CHLR|nr:hypothetical protein KDH_23270 [Dictyobacter sp. S3.2.2.5]